MRNDRISSKPIPSSFFPIQQRSPKISAFLLHHYMLLPLFVKLSCGASCMLLDVLRSKSIYVTNYQNQNTHSLPGSSRLCSGCWPHARRSPTRRPGGERASEQGTETNRGVTVRRQGKEVLGCHIRLISLGVQIDVGEYWQTNGARTI